MKKLLFVVALFLGLTAQAQTYLPLYGLPIVSGTDTYTVSIAPPISLNNGATLKLKFTNANTGAATLNVNGTGQRDLRTFAGDALSANQIRAGSDWLVFYDLAATQWRLISGGGSSGVTTDATLQGDGVSSPLGLVTSGVVIPTNNGSDFSNVASVRNNLHVANRDTDVRTVSSTTLTIDGTYFPENNNGKFVEIKASGSSPQTFTIANDATLGLSDSHPIIGFRVTGTSTLTLAAQAPSTITSTSGSMLAPPTPFFSTLSRDAAGHWYFDNSGTPLGSANQILGVDNLGVNQEYKTVSNGLTAAAGSIKLGGALTADTNLSGAFSLGIGATPTAKLHVVGLGTTTGSLAKFTDNLSVSRWGLLDNGAVAATANISGDASTAYSWNPTLTLTGNNQTQGGFDFVTNKTPGAFTGYTYNLFRLRDSNESADYFKIVRTSGAIAMTINCGQLNFNNGAGSTEALLRNNVGSITLNGGVAASTRSLSTSAVTASNTDGHFSFNVTGANQAITTAVTRNWGQILIDASNSSTNASGVINNRAIDIINTVTANSGTGNHIGIHHAPTITGGTTSNVFLQGTGRAAIGQDVAPTSFMDLAASTTAASSLRLRSGSAPTSPNDGDFWYDGTNVSFRSTNTYLVPRALEGSATLDFGSTAATAVADLTISVTNAAVGDKVILGVPNGSVTATATFWAWVSSAGTVTVRFSPKATEDPASGTFKVTVVK